MKQAVPVSRYLVYLAIAVGVCATDLGTKSWMFAHLGMPDGREPWWLWHGVFGFQTSLNRGALFGMGQGMVAVFAALSIAAAIGIASWLFVFGAARDWLLTIALALVTAGILGNLYDRLSPLHAVRDFILVMIGNWPWPTFNVADSSLVCGAILLIWHSLFVKTECECQGEETGA